MAAREPGGHCTARWTAGSRLAALAVLGLPLALLDGGSGVGLAAALCYDALLLAVAALEARGVVRVAPSALRKLDGRLSLGARSLVTIALRNPSPRALRVCVRDDLPDGWLAASAEIERVVELPPHARREVTYTVVPPRRGSIAFGDIHLRVEGRARLGAAIITVPARAAVRVYPDVLGTRRYELATRASDPRSTGFRNTRVSGSGGEFERLREYAHNDPYRDLDWKSTAKRHRPITRVYQQERAQTVLVALDIGRMMGTALTERAPTEVLTKLDHAINAALLLAYVALRQGDRVGLIVFSDVVRTFLPPRRGMGHYRALLDALCSVQAELTFVDFRRLVEFIQMRVPRRSLVVVLSDLLDEAYAMPLVEHAAVLRRKHLPVCVTMQDPVAEQIASMRAHSSADVYRRAAAADVMAEREAVKARLRKMRVDIVEAPPGKLAVATVNKYLEVKARRAL